MVLLWTIVVGLVVSSVHVCLSGSSRGRGLACILFIASVTKSRGRQEKNDYFVRRSGHGMMFSDQFDSGRCNWREHRLSSTLLLLHHVLEAERVGAVVEIMPLNYLGCNLLGRF